MLLYIAFVHSVCNIICYSTLYYLFIGESVVGIEAHLEQIYSNQDLSKEDQYAKH